MEEYFINNARKCTLKKINKDGIDVRIMQLRNSKCGLIFTRFYINYMGDELHVYGFMENY